MPQDFDTMRIATLDSHKLLAEPLYPLSSQRRHLARSEHCQPHNILDIKKVEAGVDVRTTVSFDCLLPSLANIYNIDHAAKYSEQDHCGRLIAF